MHRETPNSRVRRWEARDPQAGELRQAACQHAVVADGMNAVLSTHAPAFFVSSCPRVRHSQLPHPRDRRTRRCFFDHTKPRSHEEILLGPRSSVAAHGVGRRRNGLGEGIARGDAEAWARTLRLCVSAGGSTSCTRKRSSVATHGIGRRRDRLGRESPAETRRRGGMGKNSASLRADQPHAPGDPKSPRKEVGGSRSTSG